MKRPEKNASVNGHQSISMTMLNAGVQTMTTTIPQNEIPRRKNQPIKSPINQKTPRNTKVLELSSML